MRLFARGATRRSFLSSLCAALPLMAQETKGETFPASFHRYSDPTTELDVIRLTDPAYSSELPAWYNRVIARNSGSLLFSCDRGGSPQAFRMDLKTAQTRQLTSARDLDGSSLTMMPDNRSSATSRADRFTFAISQRCTSARYTKFPPVGSGARD